MSGFQEEVIFLTYTFLIWPEWVIGYSWEGFDPTILDIGK